MMLIFDLGVGSQGGGLASGPLWQSFRGLRGLRVYLTGRIPSAGVALTAEARCQSEFQE